MTVSNVDEIHALNRLLVEHWIEFGLLPKLSESQIYSLVTTNQVLATPKAEVFEHLGK